MNQTQRRRYMIKYLLNEESRYKGMKIPCDPQGQRELLRALMNVWTPAPLTQEFLEIQDAYLSEENASAGITDVNDLEPLKADSRLYLWQGDITSLKIDAITNPANSALLGCFRPLHNCADNIIHSKSGLALRQCCYQIMSKQGYEEPAGQAKITPGYNLPCKYVLHTVGPIVQGELTREHEELLASCYRSCLKVAADNGLQSIAFCCISTGVFMFPNERAAEIAVQTVKDYLSTDGRIKKVVFNVFKDIDLCIYRRLLGENQC